MSRDSFQSWRIRLELRCPKHHYWNQNRGQFWASLKNARSFLLEADSCSSLSAGPEVSWSTYAQSGADWRCLCCYISYGTPPPSRGRESNGKVQIKEWPMERGRGVGISWAYYSRYMVAGFVCIRSLSPIASVILQIPPTSAAPERNWSLFGNTHTKVRNRLTNDRVEKLVAIRFNLKLFEPNADVSTQLDYDSEVNGGWKFKWIWRWNRTSWLRKQVTIQHTDWKGLNKGL